MAKVVGLSFKQAGDYTIEQLRKGMRKAILFADKEIKADPAYPTDIGQLKSSQYTKVENNHDGNIEGTLGNRAEYAFYVHEGTGLYANNGQGRKTPWLVRTIYKGKIVSFRTKGQKPQPFITKHTELHKDTIARLVGGELVE